VRQQVNLYQPIFRKQEKKFSATAMMQSIAIISVGIVLLFAWTQWQVSLLKSELTRTDQQLAAVTKRLNDVTQQFGGRTTVSTTVEQEIARLEQVVGSQQRVRDTLSRGLFSNTKGFSEYLAAFARQARHAPDVSLTGFDIIGAAEQMTLQGRSGSAEAVPRYVQRLSVEKPLAGIEFRMFQIARPDAKKAGSYVDFTLTTAATQDKKQ
jgi:hypothetical protein